MKIEDVKRYEVEQFERAFNDGTQEAWKKYRTNVTRMVNRYNKEHAEKIDIEMLMS